MIEKPARIAPEEILSEFHMQMLSRNAVQVYICIWEKLCERGATEIWLDDAVVSRRARVQLRDIPKVQSELASVGLFEMLPGFEKVRYTFVADPEAVTLDTLDTEAAQ